MRPDRQLSDPLFSTLRFGQHLTSLSAIFLEAGRLDADHPPVVLLPHVVLVVVPAAVNPHGRQPLGHVRHRRRRARLALRRADRVVVLGPRRLAEGVAVVRPEARVVPDLEVADGEPVVQDERVVDARHHAQGRGLTEELPVVGRVVRPPGPEGRGRSAVGRGERGGHPLRGFPGRRGARMGREDRHGDLPPRLLAREERRRVLPVQPVPDLGEERLLAAAPEHGRLLAPELLEAADLGPQGLGDVLALQHVLVDADEVRLGGVYRAPEELAAGDVVGAVLALDADGADALGPAWRVGR